MTIRDQLLAELDAEVPFIRRCLERVPLDKRGWKPHEKSMTLGWLSTFMCVMWSWGTITIERDVFDPMARQGAGERPAEPGSTSELLGLFDGQVAAFRAALAGTTDSHLEKTWTLLWSGEVLFERPRWQVLQTYILNHAVHHRAQLGVYLRLNGIAVPAIYNDSADEKGGLFRD